MVRSRTAALALFTAPRASEGKRSQCGGAPVLIRDWRCPQAPCRLAQPVWGGKEQAQGVFRLFDKSTGLEYNARMYSGKRPRSWALVKECSEFGKGGRTAKRGVRSRSVL